MIIFTVYYCVKNVPYKNKNIIPCFNPMVVKNVSPISLTSRACHYKPPVLPSLWHKGIKHAYISTLSSFLPTHRRLFSWTRMIIFVLKPSHQGQDIAFEGQNFHFHGRLNLVIVRRKRSKGSVYVFLAERSR